MGLCSICKMSRPFFIHFSIVICLSFLADLNLLEFLGLNLSVALTINFIGTLWNALYSTVLGPALGHNLNLRKLGSWAVVTGATDGIGLEYSRQLASQGLSIVLISRNLQRLELVAQSLQKEYSVDTKIIQMDFSIDAAKAYDALELSLEGMDIGTLINNVGLSYSRPTHFHEIPNSKQFIREILCINTLAVTLMTRTVLPGMLRRGKGAIVNVGSYVSCHLAPWYSLYSASKAYMDKFTGDMAAEYEEYGIVFQYQMPGYVATKMSKIKSSSFGAPSPRSFVRVGLSSIGLSRRTAVWPAHRLFIQGLRIMKLLLGTHFHTFLRNVMRSFWLYAKKRELQKELNLEIV